MKFLKNKEISKDPRGWKNEYGNGCRYVNFGHLNPSHGLFFTTVSIFLLGYEFFILQSII